MKRQAQLQLPAISDKTWDNFEYYFVENIAQCNIELNKFLCWHSQYKKIKDSKI